MALLEGCPYRIGLHYKGVYMGYPYPNFAYVLFWDPGSHLKVLQPLRRRAEIRAKGAPGS